MGGHGPMGVMGGPVGGVNVGHGPTVGAAWSYVGGLQGALHYLMKGHIWIHRGCKLLPNTAPKPTSARRFETLQLFRPRFKLWAHGFRPRQSLKTLTSYYSLSDLPTPNTAPALPSLFALLSFPEAPPDRLHSAWDASYNLH